MPEVRGSRSVTAPKGRPTPSRRPVYRRRTFGPVFQWAAVALLGALLFAIAVMLLDGGDINPFDDPDTTIGAGQMVASPARPAR